MNLTLQAKCSIMKDFMKETKSLFSQEIYVYLISDSYSVSIDTLLYNTEFQSKKFTDVMEILTHLDVDNFLENYENEELILWFKSKVRVINDLKQAIKQYSNQIESRSIIEEKLNNFYDNNQNAIDNWYIKNNYEFDDNTSIRKIFIQRFDENVLFEGNMRSINLFFDQDNLVPIIQSYHKDKISEFY